MKSTELMIGDLINGFGVVRRVISIQGLVQPEDDGLLTTMIPGCEFPNSNLSFRACYALPIPLTVEILEKNGWKKEDVFGSLIKYRFTGPIDIETGGETFRLSNNYFFCGGIHYVHKLQHALRICGIEKEITV